MESTVFFKSDSDTFYLYNDKPRTIMRVSPLIEFYYNLEKDGKNAEVWVESVLGDKMEIDNVGEVSKKELQYYLRKYFYYKQQHFFTEKNQAEQINVELNPETIKYNLANLRQLVFEVTDACNLNCYYCGYGHLYSDYDPRQNKMLDLNNAKALLRYLTDMWNSPLNTSHDKQIYISFYGGEPLMNFKFIEEIVKFAKQLQIKNNYPAFSMTTNAVLLHKYIDFLAKNKFNLLISLDGNQKNNDYRVFNDKSPAFNKIIENVKLLKKKYPGYYQNHVNFNAVLHNKNSVSDIYNFIKKEFDKIPTIGSLNNSGIKEEKKEEFLNAYANFQESLSDAEDYAVINKDMFIKLPSVQELTSLIHTYTGFVYKDYLELFKERDKKDKFLITSTCLPFSMKFYLTVNNKIMACERISHQFDLGKVENGKVELDLNKIAKIYSNYFSKVKKQCSTCYLIDSCKQCIFYLENLDNNPVCHGYFNKKEFKQYLGSYLTYLEKNPELYTKIMEEVHVS